MVVVVVGKEGMSGAGFICLSDRYNGWTSLRALTAFAKLKGRTQSDSFFCLGYPPSVTAEINSFEMGRIY